MLAYTATGGRAAWVWLALALIVALSVIAALAGGPSRPAQAQAQPVATVNGLAIASSPLLSVRVGEMALDRPIMALSWASDAPLAPHTWYAATDVIVVEVLFSDPVRLVTRGNSPTQTLTLNLASGAVNARYAGADESDGRYHTFTYTVGAGDRDNDGLSIGAGALRLHESWFVIEGEECEAREEYVVQQVGREPVKVERPFTCDQRGANLGLAGHTIENDHQHRVQAQTPEAVRNLTARVIPIYSGANAVELRWEYSALLDDNAPTAFFVQRTALTSAGAPDQSSPLNDEFRLEASERSYTDNRGGEALSGQAAALQYRIYAENAHGQGAGASAAVKPLPR